MLQIRYSVRSVGMDDIVLRRGEPVIIEDVRADNPLAQDYREAVGDLLDDALSLLSRACLDDASDAQRPGDRHVDV